MSICPKPCPLCKKSQGVPLIYGDLDLLDGQACSLILGGSAVGGGDAITIDNAGRTADMACLSCGAHWGSKWEAHG